MNGAEWIIDQLVQQGVRHFCVAPGSRSTPLVLAAAEHPGAKIHVHYDERGLGFFALGLGKASLAPAAVIATSGTAVGNLLPSVMEAHHACTPLLLLTSDRPPELRDCGANQTTDQVKLFQSFVRWQADLPCQCNEDYFRSIAAQAVFSTCQNPPGPVQINCQFREPFPISSFRKPFTQFGNPIRFEFPKSVPPLQKSPHSKGIILVGKLPHPNDIHPILELGKKLQWPIFADILSNARSFPTPEQIVHFDWILKQGAELVPEQILHFGERLASKKIGEWLKEIRVETTHISPHPFLQDPSRILNERIQADCSEFCSRFEAVPSPTWLPSWQETDAEIHSLLEAHFETTSLFTEAHAMRLLSQAIPPSFSLFFGNGMPIRDADHFLLSPNVKAIFGNRGLSGIDGNIATAAGLAIGLNSPVLAFIGDQAALHDLNSLPLLKKTSHPVHLLVSNNFGGGIFSHLPIAQSPHFETLFAAAHDLHFRDAAQQFQISYTRLENPSEQDLKNFLNTPHSSLLEIITDRKANHQFQKYFSSFLNKKLQRN